jgi:hypothetical protein
MVTSSAVPLWRIENRDLVGGIPGPESGTQGSRRQSYRNASLIDSVHRRQVQSIDCC